MNIFELFKQWKLKKELTKINSTVSDHGLNRKECVALLKLLDSSKFKNYDPVDGSAIRLNVRYVNIPEYIQKILATTAMVNKQTPIPVGWDVVDVVDTTLDSFLTGGTHYINIVDAIESFRTYSLNLCSVMKDADDAEYGIHEHNKRMITKFLNNIRIITNKLIEVTLK